MAGSVVVGEQRVDKPGAPVAEDAPIRVRGKGHDYVSRGALKLVHGLDHFACPSTGGPAWTWARAPAGSPRCCSSAARGACTPWTSAAISSPGRCGRRRVVSLEQTHARDLTPAIIPEPIDLLVADVSFISLRQALPPVFPLLAPGADLVVLVKPQFEAQAGEVEPGGLVRDPAVHARTCAEVSATLEAAGFNVRPAVPCALLRGTTGNQEYLLAARRLRPGLRGRWARSSRRSNCSQPSGSSAASSSRIGEALRAALPSLTYTRKRTSRHLKRSTSCARVRMSLARNLRKSAGSTTSPHVCFVAANSFQMDSK